jgi:hypothetical protein
MPRSVVLGGGKAPAGWQKVFEVEDRASWVGAIAAVGDDDWFVGGKAFIGHGRGVNVTKEPLPSGVVLGFGSDERSLFALGDDQLILRYDGSAWRHEHEARSKPEVRSRDKFADVLHSVQRLQDGASLPLFAFGPSALLIRQENGTWSVPAGGEHDQLQRLATTGRLELVPQGCDSSEWLWIGRGKAWFLCADRRVFMMTNGGVASAGRAPAGCYGDVSASVVDGDDLYASCGGGLWRERRGDWTRVPAPDGVRSIAVGSKCLFVATRREVWRRCEAR